MDSQRIKATCWVLGKSKAVGSALASSTAHALSGGWRGDKDHRRQRELGLVCLASGRLCPDQSGLESLGWPFVQRLWCVKRSSPGLADAGWIADL